MQSHLVCFLLFIGLLFPLPLVAETSVTEDTSSFFSSGLLLIHPRLYWLNRRYDSEQGVNGFDANGKPIRIVESRSDREALSIGGWLNYQTGLWSLGEQFSLRLGISPYTSQKLYGPDNMKGSGLLNLDNNGSINVMGESYADVLMGDYWQLKLGRQALDTPYVGRQDNRALPRTYEGIRLQSRGISKFYVEAAVVGKVKAQNSSTFVDISESVGASSNEHLWWLGSRWQLAEHYKLQAWWYQLQQSYSIFYIDASYQQSLDKSLVLELGLQYTGQNTVGQQQLGDNIDSEQWGMQIIVRSKDLMLQYAYTQVDDSAGIRTDFNTPPTYTAAIIGFFERAGERANMVRGKYHFSQFGAPNLSFDFRYVNSSVPKTDTAGDLKELNYTLKYTVNSGPLNSLTLQLRLADLKFSENPDFKEWRFVVDYNLYDW